jgi:hypothetical protein
MKNILIKLAPNFLLEQYGKIKRERQKKKLEEERLRIHRIKQEVINKYITDLKYEIFIESGTYLGDMIEVQKNKFAQLYSIEVVESLFKQAVLRFKQDKHIEILLGDSGKVLHELMPKIKQSVIFWLDGHYSGGVTGMGELECPIFGELEAITNSLANPHCILIDDARLFVGANSYPTIQELDSFFKKKSIKFNMIVADDIIQILIHP